jgi:ribonuclease HI
MSKITIYTDGACSGNPGPGGWAALIIYENKEISISGGEENTTNNRMELLATIRAIEKVGGDESLEIYTDSKYVRDGITLWIHKWKQNGWRTADKKPVKNIDLWQHLDKIIVKKSIQWQWVKGHSGDKYNDLVDQLAVDACNKIKK